MIGYMFLLSFALSQKMILILLGLALLLSFALSQKMVPILLGVRYIWPSASQAIDRQALLRHCAASRWPPQGGNNAVKAATPAGWCGQVAEWLMAADCKSARESVRWFESSPVHHNPSETPHSRRLWEFAFYPPKILVHNRGTRPSSRGHNIG